MFCIKGISYADSIREWGAGPQIKGGWRKLENEDRNDLYRSTDIIRLTKARTMKWDDYGEEWGGGGRRRIEIHTDFGEET
jgi:hypothetical protein